MKLERLRFPPPLLGRGSQFITCESRSCPLFIANNCTELESLSKLSNMRSRLVYKVSDYSRPKPRFHVTVGQAWMGGSAWFEKDFWHIFDIFLRISDPDNDRLASKRVLAEEITFKFQSWGTDSIWEDQGGLIPSIIITTILFNEENTLLS